MENLKNYLTKVPSEFWLYNGILGFIWYLLTSEGILHLVLFPFAVLMVRFICLRYLKDISVTYVGAYPIKNDLKWALITFMISFVIFQASVMIIILGALFLVWQERQV